MEGIDWGEAGQKERNPPGDACVDLGDGGRGLDPQGTHGGGEKG